MKAWKKYAALVLAGAMMASMTACGKKEDKAEDGKDQAAALEITAKEDLADLTIGVQSGTTGDIQCSDIVKNDSQVQRFPKGAAAVQALKAGKLDCVVIDSQPAAKFVEANDDLKIIDGLFDEEEYAIAIKKGNTELKEKMNAALKELKDEGTLDKIINNYVGEPGSFQYESPEGTDYSNGKLVMATNAEFEPWEYYEGDTVVGIDADIAKALCDKMGYDLEIQDMEFDSILATIASGKADFGAAGMTVLPDRLENAEFTDTYANATQVVIVRK